MDILLKDNSLDLCLSPYAVIATGSKTGFVECVPNSTTIASILKNCPGGIQEYLERHNPDSFEKALDNYVRSCGKYISNDF